MFCILGFGPPDETRQIENFFFTLSETRVSLTQLDNETFWASV